MSKYCEWLANVSLVQLRNKPPKLSDMTLEEMKEYVKQMQVRANSRRV